MTSLVSAVVVSYRSAALAVAAIASLRKEAESSGLEAEVVAVVNSGDLAERDALRRSADSVLLPDRNLGFSGGLNAGIREARGDRLVLMNPDVVLKAGALRALLDPLEAPLTVTGPVFFWDDGETILLPPAEEPTPRQVLRRRLASGSCTGEGDAVFRRELRRAREQAASALRGETVAVSGLSGALMATSRRALDEVGPFDEGYRLYYEENDWQRRLRLAGGRILRCGAARVVHRYARSSRSEPLATGWFAESERRYFETHFGASGLRALATPAAFEAPAPASLQEERLEIPRATSPAVCVSPLPTFHPFAFTRLARGASLYRLPPDVSRPLSGETWYLRAVDLAGGRILAQGSLRPSLESPPS